MKLKTPITPVNAKEARLGLQLAFASNKFLVDTNTATAVGSRLDDYWKQNGFTQIYKGFSKTKRQVTLDDINRAVAKFRLKGIEFGNWLTNDDALNYLSALVIAFNDLTKVVGYSNLGFDGLVGIAFGARGHSRAAGHFEPATNMINLTRYKRYIENPFTGQRVDVPKEKRFTLTGGVGSMAHEYGHALDYVMGGYVDQSSRSRALTMGRVTDLVGRNPFTPGSLRYQMTEIIRAVQETRSYLIMVDVLHKKGEMDSYWLRHNELWARLFEQWVGDKMRQKGITNEFLHKSKYKDIAAKSKFPVYLTTAEFARISPKVDRLMEQIAKLAND